MECKQRRKECKEKGGKEGEWKGREGQESTEAITCSSRRAVISIRGQMRGVVRA